MQSMRVVNIAWDEKIDKILESVSRVETMISQLSLNNDFESPTKLSSQKTRLFSNRLKAKSSDIDIHTAISDNKDDLIKLDKRYFTYDDAFNIKINMDKPVSPTIRAATKKKNISKGKTIMGTQKNYRSLPQAELESQRLSPNHSINSRQLVVTDTIRAIRSDFDHFILDRTITDKILELAALRCTDEQSDVSFKTTWQLPSRFVIYVPIQQGDHWYLMVILVDDHTIYHLDTHFNDNRIHYRERVIKTLANVLEQVIMLNFYKGDGIQEYNK
ncbi:hypothetical protein S245_032581 [Arachis hypogaea]